MIVVYAKLLLYYVSVNQMYHVVYNMMIIFHAMYSMMVVFCYQYSTNFNCVYVSV